MAGFLSGVGDLTYYGVKFPNQIKAQVTSVPVRDTANRHSKYYRHTLTVETIFHEGLYDRSTGSPVLEAPPGQGGETVDTYFQEMRRRLLVPEQTLIFDGKGFGSVFRINTQQQDVSYGPKPELLTWESIGSNKAVRCVWTVTVEIAECVNGETVGPSSLRNRLAEINYTMSWDIGEDGLTQRTVAAIMELGVNRDSSLVNAGAGTISHSVDFFRNNLSVPVPRGFSRTAQNWTISGDKRTMNVLVRDEEIASDNPYFPGVIRPRVTYRLSNRNISFQLWNASLSGTISVAQGVPRWFAWAAFLLVVKSKRDASVNARVKTQVNGQTCSKKGGITLTENIDIAEEVYGREMSFSVGWLLSCDLETLFQGAGVWKPVGGGLSWEGYRSSMTTLSRAWSNRGHAQMFHRPSDDTIIDLCPPGPQTVRINNTVQRGISVQSSDMFKSACPAPAASWLVFQNEVELVRDSNTVAHFPLQDPESQVITPPDLLQKPQIDQIGNILAPIIQFRSASEYRVRMKGWALRVCYEVPRIHIRQYGGVRATLVGKDNQTHKLLSVFDLPVYISRWDKTYVLHGVPKTRKTDLKEECVK